MSLQQVPIVHGYQVCIAAVLGSGAFLATFIHE